MKTIHISSHDLVAALDTGTVTQARALRAKNADPHLAVVACGESGDSPFIRIKQEKGRELGVEVSVYRLPESARYADVESVLNFINDDTEVAGAIVQLPLPDGVSAAERDRLLAVIAPHKDVDALSAGGYIAPAKSVQQIIDKATAKKRFVPTTAASMLLLAEQESVDLTREVVVVGKGVLVGKPIHALLDALGVRHRWVDKTDAGYMDTIKAADVIFAGTDAVTPFLTKRTVKKGAIVLAAGREIDHDSLEGHVAMVSAKIGCIGPLTVSLLLQNTVTTAAWQL